MGIESLFGYGQQGKISVSELKKPLPLDDGLKQQHQEYEDCTSCRIMGSAVFTGLGIYTYASGRSQLKQRELEILRSGSRFGLGARKFGIFGLSAMLVGMGVYRLGN